jgi:hypothetical protein
MRAMGLGHVGADERRRYAQQRAVRAVGEVVQALFEAVLPWEAVAWAAAAEWLRSVGRMNRVPAEPVEPVEPLQPAAPPDAVTPGPALQRPDLVVHQPAGFWRRHALGTAALVAGIAGLAAKVLPPLWIAPPQPPSVKQLVLHFVFAQRLVPDVAYDAALHTWQRIAAVLGVASLALGLIAAIRRQHKLLVACALGLAAVVLLWEYALIALIVAMTAAILVLAAAAHA